MGGIKDGRENTLRRQVQGYPEKYKSETFK